MLKEKRFRVALVSIITGVIITIVDMVLAFIMAKDASGWTMKMGNMHFAVTLVLSLVLFFGAGFLCFKDMSRREVFKSSLIVIGYYVFILLFERLIFGLGLFSLTNLYMILFTPVQLYTKITQIVLKVFGNVWVGVFISLFSPLLFIFFARRKELKD